MKQTKFFSTFVLSALLIGFVNLSNAQVETKSRLLKQMNDGNWPSDTEAQELRDELYYNMAIQAYITMLPALNTIGMRDGSEKALGAGYNVVAMWKD